MNHSTKGMRDEEQMRTPQTTHIKSQTNKEELQQRNRLGKVSRKITGMRWGRGVKLVLLSLNITLNSYAVPSFTYSRTSVA